MEVYYIEAFSVGVLTAIIGYILANIIVFNLADTTHLLLFLLILGMLIHLLCEATGLNSWYCKNGNACKTN